MVNWIIMYKYDFLLVVVWLVFSIVSKGLELGESRVIFILIMDM